MRDAIVFNKISNLDFQDIRTNVIRIPEVVARVREAQKIWDTLSGTPLDLANFIGSEDAIFLGNIKLKAFASAVVQAGLFDRYLKNHAAPEFLVGVVNGDSALKYAAGSQNFFDLVAESPAVSNVVPARAPSALPGDIPMLSGVHLAEYAVFQRTAEGTYQRLELDARELDTMILDLVDRHGICRLVSVGPGNTLGKRAHDLASRDVQVLESIDLDPMLSWFWQNLRENRLAIAN
jgi:hypothetical protein